MKLPKREVLVVVVGILILGLAGSSALPQKKKEVKYGRQESV